MGLIDIAHDVLPLLTTAGKRDPWPFTSGIEKFAALVRLSRTWLPLLAGALFFAALLMG